MEKVIKDLTRVAAAIDVEAILSIFRPFFKSAYDLVMGLMPFIMLVVIAVIGVKYQMETEKEDRNLLDFIKKAMVPIVIAVISASLIYILPAFGFRLF